MSSDSAAAPELNLAALQVLHEQPRVITIDLDNAHAFNQQLIAQFTQQRDTHDTRRSHFFAGRFENIYIDQEHIPLVSHLLKLAKSVAQHLLGIPSQQLRAGCWFNEMQPGDLTGRHNHDDQDELLSGTYYLSVPQHSGALILHTPQSIRITAAPGRFIFFPPDLDHEVDINQSTYTRLSLGINISAI